MQNNVTELKQVAVAGKQADAPHGIALSIRGLSKQYGERTVLKSLDLEIRAGEFLAIVGRSGCGKSTLLRQIAGLETPSAGEIRFDGERVEGQHPDARMMFQDARLLPWKSVEKNIALGLADGGLTRARALLEQVGLPDRPRDWPARLSGGQRQRVALARALVHEPRLLLLDEPLGALDALTRIEMQTLIENLWRKRGITAILVTHDVSEAIALADRVVLIEDGTITLDRRIDLPRPRERGSAAFASLEDAVLKRVLQHPADAPDAELGDISLERTVHQVRWAV